VKSTDLTDCIRACTGDHDIGQREEIRELFFDVFILYITFSTIERLIHFAFAAEMDNLEFFQKFRKNLADMVVDRGCTEAPADYHKDRFVGSESAELSAGFFVTFQKLLTDWSTGKDCFVCRKTAVSGKLQHTLTAEGIQSLLARPGVISDS